MALSTSKQTSTHDACNCDFLLGLSSAHSHDILREKLTQLVADQLPDCHCIIKDEYQSFAEGNGQTQVLGEFSSQLPIYNIQGYTVGSITLHSDKPFDINDNLSQAFELYNNIYQLLCSSHYDALTQLHNRKSFEVHMNRLYQQSLSVHSRKADHQHQHVLGMIDIDHFKAVNDTYGHQLGDEILVLVSQIMKNALRDDDLLFRFGGEEFVLILHRCSPALAAKTINRLRERIANYQFPQIGKLSISIGYCGVDTAQNYDLLLERADAALYYVKENGRNNCTSYEQLISEEALCPIEQRSGDIELF